MEGGLSMTWLQWVGLVEIPVVVWLINRRIKDREDLLIFKTDVAEKYASIAYLRDVERRLVAHLERIEDGLDRIREAKK